MPRFLAETRPKGGVKLAGNYPPHTENEPECPAITLW